MIQILFLKEIAGSNEGEQQQQKQNENQIQISLRELKLCSFFSTNLVFLTFLILILHNQPHI